MSVRPNWLGLAVLLACLVTTPVLATVLRFEPHRPHEAESPRPQVLGLIATIAPTPLTCADGVCSGSFSTFCMQEKRAQPSAGQRYDFVGPAAPVLVTRDSAGAETRLSATGLLSFVSEGSYTAIRISLPTRRLPLPEAAVLAVEIPSGAALVPHLDDDNPAARQADLEFAEGPVRIAAESFFETPNARADSAMILSRLINLMPSDDDPKARRDAWDRAADPQTIRRRRDSDGVSHARDSLERCNAYADLGYRISVRGCLDKARDELLKSLNRDFWDGEPGS